MDIAGDIVAEKIRKQKVQQCLDELVDTYDKHKLSVGEIIIVTGNLLYALGASIAGFKSNGPAIDQLQKMYHADPKLSTALMLQGALMTTWYDDLDKVSEPSNVPQTEVKDKEN